ncbi:MAG TPA: YceI family protein [Flavobacteriaceae bacterium]|nr:YceI family protein [Flavobacteriaceae bacterium]
MKYLYLLLLFGFSTLAQVPEEKRHIEILNTSSLKIKGKTNVNVFECDFNSRLLNRSGFISLRNIENGIRFQDAVLQIPNSGFDCGNKGINKDFQTLLKSENHPQIEIKLLYKEQVNDRLAMVKVQLSIAGKSKIYQFPLEVDPSCQKKYSGKWQLRISDFDLEAPKKLFGMIVIKEEIEIDFHLHVKA